MQAVEFSSASGSMLPCRAARGDGGLDSPSPPSAICDYRSAASAVSACDEQLNELRVCGQDIPLTAFSLRVYPDISIRHEMVI